MLTTLRRYNHTFHLPVFCFFLKITFSLLLLLHFCKTKPTKNPIFNHKSAGFGQNAEVVPGIPQVAVIMSLLSRIRVAIRRQILTTSSTTQMMHGMLMMLKLTRPRSYHRTCEFLLAFFGIFVLFKGK